MKTESVLGLSAGLLLAILAGYFLMLLALSWWVNRRAKGNNAAFFQSERKTAWYVIAFGTIGGSLSGVTFVSVPAAVGNGGLNQQFSYWQLVCGYVLGYLIIAWVLLPIYYRMNLVSIYGYLQQRFGFFTYKAGASLFLLSRSIGTAFRLYLTANILHSFVFEHFGISFAMTVLIILILIYLYTYSGGVNTIVWTDTVQTVFMLLSVFATVYYLCESLNIGSVTEVWGTIENYNLGKIFFFDDGWSNQNNFFKQFLAGASTAVAMTGLDQDMMQKNLSCKTLKDAQKNLYLFSAAVLVMNFVFLIVGALLAIYAKQNGLAGLGDKLFPTIALQHLPVAASIFFIIGLTAAAYASTDSALAAMTTAFCVDIWGMKSDGTAENNQANVRKIAHFGIMGLVFAMIMFFWTLNNQSIISSLLIVSGYTYGPLLGLYAFGIFGKRRLRDKLVPIVCIIAPLLTYFININSQLLFWGYKFSFETLLLNGFLSYLGLWLISLPPAVEERDDLEHFFVNQ